MPDALLHVGASVICPHGGQMTTIPSSTRVLVGGQPVATTADTFLVAGCAFTPPSGTPQPCMQVQWLVPATRILIDNQPAILQTSIGLCQSAAQIPQGPPTVVAAQMRAMGT